MGSHNGPKPPSNGGWVGFAIFLITAVIVGYIVISGMHK